MINKMIIPTIILGLFCCFIFFLPWFVTIIPSWQEKFEQSNRIQEKHFSCTNKNTTVHEYYLDNNLGPHIEVSHTFLELWSMWKEELRNHASLMTIVTASLIALLILNSTENLIHYLRLGIFDVVFISYSLLKLRSIKSFYDRKIKYLP